MLTKKQDDDSKKRTMKLRLALLILVLTFNSCLEHSKQMNTTFSSARDSIDFSIKWKADSLGLNGFRANHYSFDKSTKSWLVNGVNLKGYSKEKIIKLLGSPNNKGLGKEDHLLILIYNIRQDKIEADKELIFYFDKDNNLNDIIGEG